MTDIFNFKGYSHHMESNFYLEKIKKDVPAEHLVGDFQNALFLLSSYYPILIEPSKTAVHYNNYRNSNSGSILKESDLKEKSEEIRNCFNNGYEFLMYVDGLLVANDKFTYMENWCSQPISMISRLSSYLYVTVALPHKGGMVYFIYPLKTEAGGRFLELYHGRYWSKKGTFHKFGVGIISNLIRLSYAAQHFTTDGFERAYAEEIPEDLKSYKIIKIIRKIEGGTL